MDGDTIQMQYDQAQTIPKNKFTKQYYTFVGWSTEKDGEIVYHDGHLSITWSTQMEQK